MDGFRGLLDRRMGEFVMNSGLFDVVGNIALGVRCIPRTSNAQCTSKVRSIDDPRRVLVSCLLPWVAGEDGVASDVSKA